MMFLIRLGLVLSALNVTSAIAETTDYWASTKINDQTLRNYLTQERCYSNENSFLGCIQAINEIFENNKEPAFLTNYATSKSFWAGEVIKNIEGLNLQKVNTKKDDTKNPLTLAKEYLNKVKESNDAWKLIYKNTLSNPISVDKLLTEALTGKIESRANVLAESINTYLKNTYDPHTYIMSKKAYNHTVSTKEDSYVGIGTLLSKTKQGKIELRPMEGSPALASGIRYKDILLSIDGQPASADNGFDFDKFSDRLKGKNNTPVALTILRFGKIVNLNVLRGEIVTKNISGELVVNPRTKSKVGIIKLHSFMQNELCENFVQLGKSLHSMGAESLVLDLRYNGGGDIGQVLCMAASYLDMNTLMLQAQDPVTNAPTGGINVGPEILVFKKKDTYLPKDAELYNLYDKKPLVIITNAYSASASELLPGSLRAYGKVVTVGEKSYGKGTMQSYTEDLQKVGLEKIEGVVLFKTVARFHFADGSSNQLVGLEPDIEAYTNPHPTEEDIFALREVDSYPNAINSSNSPAGISQDVKSMIWSCIKSKHDLKREYEEAEHTALGADYQMLTATAVAECI